MAFFQWKGVDFRRKKKPSKTFFEGPVRHAMKRAAVGAQPVVQVSGLVGGLFVVTGMLDASLGWALALRKRFVYSAEVQDL
jgi:hypothetical protein